MSQLSEEIILNSLKQIIDPDLRKDIVTLGFIRDLKIAGGDVAFRIVLTTPACPVKEEMESQAYEIVRGLAGVTNVKVTMDAEVPQGRGIPLPAPRARRAPFAPRPAGPGAAPRWSAPGSCLSGQAS